MKSAKFLCCLLLSFFIFPASLFCSEKDITFSMGLDLFAFNTGDVETDENGEETEGKGAINVDFTLTYDVLSHCYVGARLGVPVIVAETLFFDYDTVNYENQNNKDDHFWTISALAGVDFSILKFLRFGTYVEGGIIANSLAAGAGATGEILFGTGDSTRIGAKADLAYYKGYSFSFKENSDFIKIAIGLSIVHYF